MYKLIRICAVVVAAAPADFFHFRIVYIVARIIARLLELIQSLHLQS